MSDGCPASKNDILTAALLFAFSPDKVLRQITSCCLFFMRQPNIVSVFCMGSLRILQLCLMGKSASSKGVRVRV